MPQVLSVENIEKGIPIPPKRGGPQTSTYKDVASRMRVGDSYEFKDKGRAVGLALALRELGFAATQRKLDDGTWRVWRLDQRGRHKNGNGS